MLCLYNEKICVKTKILLKKLHIKAQSFLVKHTNFLDFEKKFSKKGTIAFFIPLYTESTKQENRKKEVQAYGTLVFISK